MDNSFSCDLFIWKGSPYPLTKYLMMQLATELALQEAALGNQVHTYGWDPGNTKSELNPVGFCCLGPVNGTEPEPYVLPQEYVYTLLGPIAFTECPFAMPYIGNEDRNGNPSRPFVPVPNFWTSPAHSAKAAIYSALLAPASLSGSYISTITECEAEIGRYDYGITPTVRSQLFNLSKSWAGL